MRSNVTPACNHAAVPCNRAQQSDGQRIRNKRTARVEEVKPRSEKGTEIWAMGMDKARRS
eukprot:1329945-Pyramimonas_sp.AAC.1